MSKRSVFCVLRARLDDAITYGIKKDALKIAREALRLAGEKGLKAEEEYFKGQLDILGKRFTSAIEHFDLAVKFNPKDGAAYNDRALCMVELGIIDEAFAYFDKGIAVEPDYATVYHNKGWLLNNIGRHTEAIKYFKIALSLEPNRPVTYDNLADSLLNLGDYVGSQAAYRKVLKLLKPGCCSAIKREIIKKIKELERVVHLK